ncbi:MAG: zinc ABC transporter substrate-binding protein [Patescibacteria group bacterium]
MQKLLLIFILFFPLVFLTGCQKETIESDDEKMQVMVSILPLVEFVEKIGGDKVEVEVAIPPGYEPHSYELTPEQLKKISDVDLYIKAGYIEFEKANMDKIIEQNSSMKVINGAEDVELRELTTHSHDHEDSKNNDHEGGDPHTWLSVNSAKIYIDNIYNALIELDSDNKDYYKSNKQAYEKELNEVDKYLKETLRNVENKKIIVYHPAFGYLLSEYGFEQIPIEIEGKEPTAAQLEELVNEAREENVKVIFVQKQFSTQNAEVVAKEINGIVVQVDPLAEDFINNLKNIGKTIFENQ